MYDATEYLKLAKAIQNAPSAPPCMVTDPEIWFASKEDDIALPRVAKKLCNQCPVQAECLEYAMNVKEQHGVWGGLTVTERQALRGQGRGRPLNSPRRLSLSQPR